MKRWIHASKSTKWLNEDIIELGQLSKTGASIKRIDVNQLTKDDIGTRVWLYRNGWDEESDKLVRGVIKNVRVDDRIDMWHKNKTVYVEVALADGRTSHIDTGRGYLSNPALFDDENAQKLIDRSNKRKGIDKATETMSRTDLYDLQKQSGLHNMHKKFDSEEYGPDADISIGSHLTDTELILFCYISPAGGGHVNHGSTIEVGYTFVNGRLKRHKGAFDMPAGRGWIDNNKVRSSSIDQFNHDVEVLEEVYANPEQYTSSEISKML